MMAIEIVYKFVTGRFKFDNFCCHNFLPKKSRKRNRLFHLLTYNYFQVVFGGMLHLLRFLYINFNRFYILSIGNNKINVIKTSDSNKTWLTWTTVKSTIKIIINKNIPSTALRFTCITIQLCTQALEPKIEKTVVFSPGSVKTP